MTAATDIRHSAGPFAVLEADPPWLFGDRLPGRWRGAAKHYECMPSKDIARVALPPLANDCVLLLWRVAAMQEEALSVVRAWGFKPKSEIVWVKTTKETEDTGAVHLAFGMGRQVRACHETCIIATRGKVKPLHHSQRSVFFAPRQKHSQKPSAFYDLVEAMYAGPRARLFARSERPGWVSFGDEIGSTLEVA